MARTYEQALLAKVKRETDATASGAGCEVADRIRAALLAHQVAVIIDPARRKSVKVPRRGGKTFALIGYALDVAERIPGSRIVLGSITLKSAKRLFWSGADGLRAWNKRYSLGIKFNDQETTATFPNGSVIMVMGFETLGDCEKIRGDRLHLVILDECKSFPQDLFDYLLDQAITPALTDHSGTVVVCGTPGSILAGRFYEATSPKGCEIKQDKATRINFAKARKYSDRDLPVWTNGGQFTWSFHEWSTKDNTAWRVEQRDGTTISLWEQCLIDQREKGWTDADPAWRREYLGEWVADDSVLVYSGYSEDRNGWDRIITPEQPFGLPMDHDWALGIGADLGFDNDFAIEVFAWCDDLPHVWHVYEDHRPGLSLRGISSVIAECIDFFGGAIQGFSWNSFDTTVADSGGQGKTVLVSLAEEYGYEFEAAEKHERTAHIEVVNSEMRDGRLYIMRNSTLASQMRSVPWDMTKSIASLARDGAPLIKNKTNKSFPQDCTDAALYLITHAWHKFSRARVPVIAPGTPEWQRKQLEDLKRKAFAPKKKGMDTYGSEVRLDAFWGQYDWS